MSENIDPTFSKIEWITPSLNIIWNNLFIIIKKTLLLNVETWLDFYIYHMSSKIKKVLFALLTIIKHTFIVNYLSMLLSLIQYHPWPGLLVFVVFRKTTFFFVNFRMMSKRWEKASSYSADKKWMINVFYFTHLTSTELLGFFKKLPSILTYRLFDMTTFVLLKVKRH